MVEPVTYETFGRVGVVTLNRPEARNAINPDTDEQLREIWADFALDDAVDVVIWTGTGTAFAPGPTAKPGSPNG